MGRLLREQVRGPRTPQYRRFTQLKHCNPKFGHVGWHLARRLHEAGAKLFVSNIHNQRMREAEELFRATPIPANRFYDATVDVFAPCALSAIINDETLPRLKAKIVAGSANNQLAEHQHGDELRARNILYAPDYAINAGGVINISYEYSGIYDQQATHRHVSGIGSMLSAILKRARRPDISTNAAAYHIAENRFRALEAAQNAFKPFVPHFGRLILVKAAMGLFCMALQELGNNFRGIGTIYPVEFLIKPID